MTPSVPKVDTQLETPPLVALEHNYRVSLGGGKQYLGTFLEIGGLQVEYETYEYAEGGNNLFVRRLRGRMKYSNLTLKAGLMSNAVLLDWVLGKGALKAPQILTIDFVTPDEEILRSFGVAHAVPVRWTGPNANIGANTVATESLEIAHHGLTLP